MKKTLLLVPHQDDEILVGGSALLELIRSEKWEVYVAYLTNGDSRGEWEAKVRIQDAYNVLSFLGLSKDNIFLLGYANRWNSERHIYNSLPDECLTSQIGKDETYGVGNYNDYAYIKNGLHHSYTRNNLKSDMMQLLKDIQPDLCMVVDMDAHEDHRATSLLFDECMGEILKDRKDYKPLILKKFAYIGVWKGEKDYWLNPHKETYITEELENPFLNWEERIQFAVTKDCNTGFLYKNTLFQAAKKYRTQYVWTRAAAFLNDDICFWRRYSENILLNADIRVSSGNAEYLNDFKILDSHNIKGSKKCEYDAGIWMFDNNDKERKIEIYFSEPKKITQINIYECSMKDSGIEKIRVSFEHGEEEIFTIERRKKNTFKFDERKESTVVTIVIDKAYGSKAGISEIEMFDDIIDLGECGLPFTYYSKNRNSGECRTPILYQMEKNYLLLKEKVVREIWLPLMELSISYPILRKWKCLFVFIQLWNISKKIVKKMKHFNF